MCRIFYLGASVGIVYFLKSQSGCCLVGAKCYLDWNRANINQRMGWHPHQPWHHAIQSTAVDSVRFVIRNLCIIFSDRAEQYSTGHGYWAVAGEAINNGYVLDGNFNGSHINGRELLVRIQQNLATGCTRQSGKG